MVDSESGQAARGEGRSDALGRPSGRLRPVHEFLSGLADPASGARLEDADPAYLLELGETILGALPAAEGPMHRESDETLLLRDTAWLWLEATRQPSFLQRIASGPHADRWLRQVLDLGSRTHFTVGALFEQRTSRHPHSVWMRLVEKDRILDLTLREVRDRVRSFSAGLHAHVSGPEQGQPVAFLAENSLSVALADLACLTTGLGNVTIPADVTGEQASYILEQTETRLLLLGSDRQIEKILPFLSGLPRLQWVYQIGPPDRPGTPLGGVLPCEELLRRGSGIRPEELDRRAAAVRWQDPATVMYTSGTTGLPKGIVFTHGNLVSKRFARALAWPQVGPEDAFLCYLPLYHTFGRWLEMLGTLFWGATYSFMESPALDTMVDNLRRTAPTVFISIPKKWIQLYERIHLELPEGADEEAGRAAVRRITGGRLRRGLSAAGYLTPEVFHFFQRYGVELASGFGMTEATGGITMTPAGEYREGTVGQALPGIELVRAEDGELLIRGPYVMQGYFGPEEPRVDYTSEWFHTGDLVEVDGDGFVTIVDRKKDIYKNVKGQTISPQRVERFFQSFGEIRQAFLVGDGREYNTILIYPNFDYDSPPLSKMSGEALREYIGTILASINSFLAPYERLLDFALLPRPLGEEQGELTPKATYRRKVVEEHFRELIEGMYVSRFSRVQVGEVEVRLPHWLLRELGATREDLLAEGDALRLARSDRRLVVARDGAGERVRVGDLWYGGAGARVDLERLLRSPDLWLGNASLVKFAGTTAVRRPQPRPERSADLSLRVEGMAALPQLEPEEAGRLQEALWREDRSLLTLHGAAVALLSSGEKEGLRLVEVLEGVAGEEDSYRAELARIALRRVVGHEVREIRSAAFRALLPNGAPEMVGPTLRSFLAADPLVLNEAGALALSRRGLPDEIMSAYLAFLEQVQVERQGQRRRRRAVRPAWDEQRVLSLLRFLAVYASDHPGWYRVARAELVRWFLSGESARVRQFARRGYERLVKSFRTWLGPHPSVAIDPHTGREYGWSDILRFDPACDAADEDRCLRVLQTLPLIKEAVFVLSGGVRLSMADIPRGGVRVLPLGGGHGKAVYRISVQTLQSGTFEIALNLAKNMAAERLESEALWLISLGVVDGGSRLVEEVGGIWPEEGLWTEEFVPGETVAQLVARVAAEERGPEGRLVPLWLHLASSAVTAYFEFWVRAGREHIPADPSPGNLIVPAHDYQEGSRLVSISERRPFEGLPSFFRGLKEGILEAYDRTLPELKGVAGCELIYAAVLDVLGDRQGSGILEVLLLPESGLSQILPGEEPNLRAFLERVRSGEHMPRRLASAIRRYHRFAAANPGASRTARARTLSDLWESYGLSDLEQSRPEVRLRFFRETVLSACQDPLRGELSRLLLLAREDGMTFEHLLREMSEVVRRVRPGEEESYFLARMTYAHLRPLDTADLTLVEQGGTRRTDLVVTHRDRAGHYFRIRHASNPREVWDLYRLFREAGLEIRFRPGHQFLVAADEAGKILGGLFYRLESGDTAHLEKIVVSAARRHQGVSEELMADFFDRLRARGTRHVTTGFFRPQYFRKFNFQVDREHAGLVRRLDDGRTLAAGEPPEPAALP